MRITQSATVVRYDVTFTPLETKLLLAHPAWRHRVAITGNGTNRYGAATLTKSQINDVCDVLGINGREFMQRYADMEQP